MGKYDAEIKKAKKIGEDWVSKSEGVRDQLISIKKDSLALEKGALTDVQKEVAKGVSGDDVKQCLRELGTIKERLEIYYQGGKKLFDDHEKWSLDGPRANMRTIDTTLKLGGVNSEKYKEVAAGIKTLLTDVAAGIAETQRVWRSDLEVAIKNQMDRITALEKILNKEAPKQGAFLEQLTKTIDRFAEECEISYNNLKTEGLLRDLEDINNGEMANKPKVVIEQKHHQAEKVIEVTPKLLEQITKNYNRVIKSVPPEFVNGWIASGQKKRLDGVYGEVQRKMTHTMKVCEAAVKLYKQKGLV